MPERTPEYWLKEFHSAFIIINLDNKERLAEAEKFKKIILAEFDRKTVKADWFKIQVEKFPVIIIEKGKEINYKLHGAKIFSYLIELLSDIGFKIRKS